MQTIKYHIIALFACFLLASCYHGRSQKGEVLDSTYTEEKIDSLTFLHNHHYTRNYNFLVSADSIVLSKFLPSELAFQTQPDSIVIKKHDDIVVADIHKTESNDGDTIWLRVARDQYTFGWIAENDLLDKVVPNDPISQFIMFFSDTHILAFLFIISIITIIYVLRLILRLNTKMVHFNDIASFYPTLLTLIVATSATFYSNIQIFAPSTWQHFYYHPTLNPFSLPTILALFLCSVWAMVIVGIAAIDDVFHKLPVGSAMLYIGGLIAVCAAIYVIFSVATMYYVGYLFFIMYVVFALYRYFKYGRYSYRCGNCGADLRRKGRCPKCGAMNE